MQKTIRIGALVSGGGTNLQAVIDACESGAVSGRMVFVGSDRPDAFGMTRAERHGIPVFHVDYRALTARYRADPEAFLLPADADPARIADRCRLMPPDAGDDRIRSFYAPRILAEAMLLEQIKAFSCDLIILAGFMRTLTPYFIDRISPDPLRPRLMNIHPSLLPAFPGKDGYGDTFRYGCKVAGCTVHFVDYGEDTGPIIGQKAFPIRDRDTLESVREKGLALEWKLYPECIQLYAENRLEVVQKRFERQNGETVVRTVVMRRP